MNNAQDIKLVFLVDDERLVRKALSRLMGREGYKTQGFAGATEALEALKESRPDCIISDYYMPHIDGLTFLEEVKELYPEIGRVLLTGGHIDSRVQEALEDETIQVLIKKPWHVESLRQVMEHIRAGHTQVFIDSDLAGGTPGFAKSLRGKAASAKDLQMGEANVLVVNEDPHFFLMMENWLSRIGYRALGCSANEQAIELTRETDPMVVIIDLQAPGRGSLDLIAALRDQFPRLAILAVTIGQDRDLAIEAFRQGATTFLHKPLEPDILELTIQRCVQLGGLLENGMRKPELAAILGLQHAIASDMAASRLLDLLMQEMIRYTGSDAASVLLVEPGGKSLRIEASYGLDERVIKDERVTVGERVSGWVVQHNETRLVIGNATDDPQLTGVKRVLPATVGVCLPMRGRKRVMGALCLTRFKGDEFFTRDAVDLGILLGGEVARALERAEESEQRLNLERSLMQKDKLVTIGELASGIAHEINNPLGYVHSNITSLKDYLEEVLPVLRCLTADGKEQDPEQALAAARKVDLNFILADLPVCLQETTEGLKRVLTIVNDLKAFAREDTEAKEVADIKQILEGVINIVWNQIKYKAELVREYSKLPGLLCYPSQLGQVFLNLLHNAAQAIESDGRIVLRTRRDGDQVVVEVEDNGQGIEPENLERVFDPFFTTKPRGVGTGLGLSIARKIVEHHDGVISVTSEKGKGATFRVVLPLLQEP